MAIDPKSCPRDRPRKRDKPLQSNTRKSKNSSNIDAHHVISLGQSIEEDLHRTKYGIPRAVPRGVKKPDSDTDTSSSVESDSIESNDILMIQKKEGKKTKKNDLLLDERTSQKILDMSHAQISEIEAEEEYDETEERRRNKKMKKMEEGHNTVEQEQEDEYGSLLMENALEDNDEVLVRSDEDHEYVTFSENTAKFLSKEEENVVDTMMGQTPHERRNLADMILQKIEEKESQQQQNPPNLHPNLPPKIIELYTELGRLLQTYSSGKLPKAFKVIPSLSNWQDIVSLTHPETWSPSTMFAATRIFASNFNAQMAQIFYHGYLLPSVREDIHVSSQRATHYGKKTLNYHYYQALRKAVYKPAAFFKGIILPLCKDPTTTLREAIIIASIVQRSSIPVHHSAVAIYKLSQYDYTAVNSMFLKTLLNKKYSLPLPVITAMVQHFVKFLKEPDQELPVLWHQCLLVFVQRYKHHLVGENTNDKGTNNNNVRDMLRRLMKMHYHAKITPEIRRELFGVQWAWKEEQELLQEEQDTGS